MVGQTESSGGDGPVASTLGGGSDGKGIGNNCLFIGELRRLKDNAHVPLS